MSNSFRDYDFYIEFKEFNTYLNIYKRKNLDRFMNYVKENCEGVVYSAGIKPYVDIVMVPL